MEKTIHFKLTYIHNEEVYQQGYVIFDDYENVTVYYYDRNGFAHVHPYVIHDGEEITGLTLDQESELALFEIDILDDSDFIEDILFNASEDEHKTYERYNYKLTIGDDKQ